MSSLDPFDVDDLMAIADAVGVTRPAQHPEADAPVILHPSVRGVLADESLKQMLTDWSKAAAGVTLCGRCGDTGMMRLRSALSGEPYWITCPSCGGDS